MTKLLNPAGKFVVLFRIGSVEVGFTPSWLVMLTFLAILFEFFGVIPESAGKVGGSALAVGLALAFYVSVLLHEGAHTVVAHVFDLEPRRIVFFLLGGVSQISRDAEEPRQEYIVALAGPAVSLLLGGIFAALARLTGPNTNSILSALSTLNIALAAFNMLPGFPLDGGRVLRSVLWAMRGDRIQATRIAAGAGRIVAVGLAVGGVAYVSIVQHDWTSVAFGTWYLVLGYFLFSHASYAEREELERLALQERSKAQETTVATSAPTIAPDIIPQRHHASKSSPKKRPRVAARVTPGNRRTTISAASRSRRRVSETPKKSARLDVLKKPRRNESNAKKSKKSSGH
ncbi:MAG: site-2 protease family protein [Actinomycetota bacterium]